MKSIIIICLLSFLMIQGHCQKEKSPATQQPQTSIDYRTLAAPDTGKIWIQPVQGKPAMPLWGHSNGIAVGLSPLPGPRGLLKIFTPYLGLRQFSVINFMALEPIPEGSDRRGLSELEMSALDNRRGKRFWSSDSPECTEPVDLLYPARGVIKKEKGKEVLTVYVFSETFENGAKVYVRLRFFEDRPHEFEITSYACADSKKLDYFIVTATMGNRARLRTLYLDGKQLTSLDVWPEYKDINFAPHKEILLNEMIRDSKGSAYFIAAPNEINLQAAEYHPSTSNNWKYEGKFNTQYWISEDPAPGLKGLVNGRYTYWASKSPIPGGIAYENFEFKEPFRNGATFVFGVTPLKPEEYIQSINKKK